MASSITLSAATRQNLLSLQDTANLLSTTQSRLSTGKKVNSALDNPTNFFTSQSLTARSSDLSNLLDGISNGVQTIQAANQGITSIQKLVDSAKSTANQALADKSAVSKGTPATNATLTAGVAFQGSTTAAADGTQDFSGTRNAVFDISDGTNTTTITLDATTLSGITNNVGKVTADNIVQAINNQLANDTTNPAAVSASKTFDGRIVFTSAATGADAEVTVTNAGGNEVDLGFGVGTVDQTANGADARDGSGKAVVTGSIIVPTGPVDYDTTPPKDSSFSIKLGDGPSKKIVLDGSTLDGNATNIEIVAEINSQFSADTGLSGKVEASLDSAGKLQITSTAVGANQKITINAAQSGLVADQIDIGFGQAAAVTPPAERVATGTNSTGSTNATRQSLANQFNELLKQISQQAKDASYNGVNLLYRDGADAAENTLRVTFNENGSSNLDIKGVKFDAEGLGLKAVEGGFQSDDDIKATLSAITTATNLLRAQSSTFGSNLSVVQNRQDFSKNLINILDTGSANLTNADLNEEAANSQALSTRNSLAISALSLANQAQQGILQLLR